MLQTSHLVVNRSSSALSDDQEDAALLLQAHFAFVLALPFRLFNCNKSYPGTIAVSLQFGAITAGHVCPRQPVKYYPFDLRCARFQTPLPSSSQIVPPVPSLTGCHKMSPTASSSRLSWAWPSWIMQNQPARPGRRHGCQRRVSGPQPNCCDLPNALCMLHFCSRGKRKAQRSAGGVRMSPDNMLPEAGSSVGLSDGLTVICTSHSMPSQFVLRVCRFVISTNAPKCSNSH